MTCFTARFHVLEAPTNFLLLNILPLYRIETLVLIGTCNMFENNVKSGLHIVIDEIRPKSSVNRLKYRESALD